jgi:2'-hydroxyisoflavone reductase
VKLLILGGTVFLGRHIVDAALAAGHDVTLFNRGVSNPGLFPDVETLHGDRTVSLDGLGGRRWDAVIDVAGYLPRVVRASARQLARQADRYTFISTISVFRDFSAPGLDESGAVGTLDDPATEEVTNEAYGPLKALCEREAIEAFPGRALVIRPGLIVGPHDPTDRFTYWPHRVGEGGEVLAPGDGESAVQVVDARDLANWTVTATVSGVAGVYNATGPAQPLSMRQMLETCRETSRSDASLTFVPASFLKREGVKPWSDMPLWIGDDASMAGFSAIDCSKAIGAGLVFRALAETVRDTLAWDRTRAPAPLRAGLSPEREREVLERWHEDQTRAV